MNKLIGIVAAVYLLGDPQMSMLEGLSMTKEFIMTIVFLVVSAPWIRAQFD
jgi:hypothetical protein